MDEELVERIKKRALEVAPREPGWEQVAAVLEASGKNLDALERARDDLDNDVDSSREMEQARRTLRSAVRNLRGELLLPPQGPYAKRYEIRVVDRELTEYRYNVCTWFDEAKGVAIACGAHRKRHPESIIYFIEANDLGRVGETETGVASPEEKDLLDRYEW